MRTSVEDSPLAEAASNPTEAALAWLLATAAGAAGADRAFLVRRTGGSPAARPEVVAAWTSGEVAPSPSRTLLWRAVAAGRTLAIHDAALDARLADAPSVRALELRSALAVPLPRPGYEGALVLDRRRPGATGEPGAAVVAACAALAGFVLGGGMPAASTAPAPIPSRPRTARYAGNSATASAAEALASRVAATDLPVLLLGESGTGKELLARDVHEASRRRARPFVPVNCAALPDALVESELFGAVKGAFTGADRDRPGLVRAARGGTLFLDEIGDLPPIAQAKLLRVLQDGCVRPVGADDETPVDVRVVAATHRDLRQRVADGAFRADLYHRIAVAVVPVPALRERLEDLPELAARIVERLAARHGLVPRSLSPSAIERLLSHDWPGNVRELEGALARAMITADEGPITAGHLDVGRVDGTTHPASTGLEAAMILRALAASGGSVAGGARRVGWSRQKLYRAMRRLGIEEEALRLSRLQGASRGPGRR